ncbi:outer membrane beta-barrel protein [Mucilaginibacter pocheonensis]|uniref:Outer membrane receptor protein involved in Fe transport n=1 Tax=Mucilaginibacter pocheonensis TaxID=398050 RepID=A0ABU1T6H8_9SPHI|nr:outer membrane beta-barrel protein [Mucilaginibacter pocheonensis]MDR6940983.1 outer membrane receptor protein involved in Fe transport [Mucilaginibacter pocheonensis]
MKTKHTTIQFIIMIAVLSTVSINSYSQTQPGYVQVKGTVADSVTEAPLPMITVRLKNSENETMMVVVTKNDGSFSFASVKPSSYSLFINAVGYGSKAIALDLAHQQQTLELKPVYLSAVTTTLREVAITAEKPIIRQKADRIIYDLKADPESKGNNVLSMMRKIPYLSLDGDDNLLLKGNSSFKVLINGKPSGSLESNLKAVLKSIPASTIERIEVITTPPSKYDAEGLAGIINIITSKKINDGINGSININASSPTGGPGIGGSITAKKGSFGISAFGGGSINNLPQTTNNRKSIDTSGAVLVQNGYQRSNNKTAYFGTELSLQIDTLNLLTAQFNYNGSRATDHSKQTSLLTGNDQLEQYAFQNTNKAGSHGIDAGLNYELGFKGIRSRLLTFSYLYSANVSNKNGGVEFFDRVNFQTPDFLQNNKQKFKEHTLQVDFVTPVKQVTIEAGLKAIFRNNSSNFGYSSLNDSTGVYQFDKALSNAFTNTQNVFSAYNSYQLTLNSWNINAGLRVEETVIRANFMSTASVADQNYFNVIPSVSVSKRFKDESSINFGFSQRIRRPGINRLNPYVDRSNPNYETTGNPNLRPVLLNDIQFGYGSNKKLSVNIGIDYSFMNNLDLQVVNFDRNTQVTQITYANTGKARSAGSNFNLSYPVTSIYNASINGNVMYLWLQGEADGKTVNNNLLMYGVTLSNVVRLAHGWALNADVGVNSRNPTGLQGYTNGFFYSAFNFNKEVIKNRFGISGGIKNPFTKYRNNISTTFGPQFNQTYQNMNYYRSFSISLSYNFGGLKDKINKSRVGIDNNDLAN